MKFSVSALHELESKVENLSDSRMVLRSDLIQTKNELIKCKSVKLEAVKETVQSEMKSFSDVVKSKSVSSGLSPAKIKMAVHSAMRDEDQTKNFIIFGAEEELECEEEEMSDKDLVKDIFGIVKGGDERSIIKCERVGVKKSTDAKRPIKVTVKDAETDHAMIIEPAIVTDGRIIFKEPTNSVQLANDSLNELICEINSRLLSRCKYTSQVENLLFDLKSECARCLKFDNIRGFGSSFNGFHSIKSDVDVVVELIEDGIDSQLIDCKKFMEKSSLFKLKDFIRSATVPIVTVKHIKSGLDCDISFSVPSINRVDVLWNTALLKAYSTNYPEIVTAFRFIKYILNFTKFGSVRTGGLSTYGHLILFIYFLTHKRHPRIPLLNVTTCQPGLHELKPKLCPAQIVEDYLRYISCELDSSQYLIDIRTSDIVARHKHFGSMGRLFIQDPYISKNLGKYMKEQQLYNFKLFCRRLLELLVHEHIKLKDLDQWCLDYNSNLCESFNTFPLHPKCELLTCTMEKTTKGITMTTSCTVNQLLCERTAKEQIKLDWSSVLGSSFHDLTTYVDTKVPKLQCVVVFEKQNDIERAELLLELMPCPKELVVASCLTKRKGAHIYLTTYQYSVSGQTDVSSVKRLYIYNPNFQVPKSMWQVLMDKLPGQLYFMISPREVPNLTCDYLDKLARLYCDLPGTVTHYRYTIPLGDLKQALLERDRRFSELPNNLEIHEITR
ncbi:hypothetical protein ACHWQZ_G014056 [Mnemiopsis leidyi]